MLQLLVLADDFTGALDTGVQFSKLGIKTRVTTNCQIDFAFIEEDVQVLVIDTESRYLSYSAAYKLIYTLAQQAKEANIPYLYKKIDSALRGNISSEIKAIWDIYRDDGVSMIPAFPKVNRIVRDGTLYIDHVPVSESIFGSDPYEPVTESNILIRLQKEANLDVQLVSSQHRLQQGGLYLFDASTDEELIEVERCLSNSNRLSVTIGCAGFASILAETLFGKELKNRITINSPLVVICGSVNPITKQQVKHAKHLGYPTYSLTGQQLVEDGYWQSLKGKEETRNYLHLLRQSNVLIFETFSQETIDSLQLCVDKGSIRSENVRFAIGKALGNLAQVFVENEDNLALLFTGGDTLFQSMQVLGISDLEPQYEISPGVVFSILEWNNQTIHVMTKSGGLGHPELFEELMRLIE